MEEDTKTGIVVVVVVLSVLALVIAGFIVYPLYHVWQQGLSGEAMLKKAEQEKRIMIETARAEVEAAKLRAEAIEHLGAIAKKYPEYRQQEFIRAFAEAMEEGNIDQIIYVPTEANIPIIEAGGRKP